MNAATFFGIALLILSITVAVVVWGLWRGMRRHPVPGSDHRLMVIPALMLLWPLTTAVRLLWRHWG